MGPSELTLEQRVELLDHTYDELRRSQHGAAIWIIGGPETTHLWDATIAAFAHANWVATVLCAQATCERTLASLLQMVYVTGIAPPGWEGWGLGRLISHCRDQRLVDPRLLDDVQTLCDERKPYGHWRQPLAEGALQRVVFDAQDRGDLRHPDLVIEDHLGDLALRSARTALRVHFGDLLDPRKFDALRPMHIDPAGP